MTWMSTIIMNMSPMPRAATLLAARANMRYYNTINLDSRRFECIHTGSIIQVISGLLRGFLAYV